MAANRDYTIILGTDSWRLGGVNAVSLNLARGLLAQGIRTKLLITNDPLTKPTFTMPRPVGVEIDELPEIRWRGWPTRWRLLCEYLERCAPCIYIPNADPSFSCASPLLLDSVSIIGILHSDAEYHYEHLRRMGTAWNAVVCVSQEIARNARMMNPDLSPEKIIAISNSVPAPSVFPSQGNRWKPMLQMIYVGRIVQHEKRVFDIPEILSRLASSDVDFTLTVVGSGPDELEFKNRVAQLGLPERVIYAGVRPPDEISKMMTDCDCLLLTSDVEGMPMVVLEAMSVGCIPVATRLPSGIPELIEPGKTGFIVDIGDVDGFANVLKSLAENTAMRRTMARNAWEAVATGPLSYGEFIRKYIALFDQVVAAGGRPPFDRERGPARPHEYLPATTPASIRFRLRKIKQTLMKITTGR